jgi:hypothetical protein
LVAPTPELWEVPTMSESVALVGLDVHVSQTHAVVLRAATGELPQAKLGMAPLEVLGFLEPLGGLPLPTVPDDPLHRPGFPLTNVPEL